ncbi:MAG TPA: hypothetical protein VIN10_09585 [Bacteroidales bacterium]
MKTHLFIIVMVAFFLFPTLSNGQETQANDSFTLNENQINSQKGNFSIALQNFAFGEIENLDIYRSFSTRAAYMISNYDMLFIGGQFSWNPRIEVDRTIETSLNYRRYFRNSAFQPFVQAGAGVGFVSYSDDYSTNNYQKTYGVLNVGAGVSYRYKRWSFEVGFQTEYNHNYTGRIYLVPLWGISFSF